MTSEHLQTNGTNGGNGRSAIHHKKEFVVLLSPPPLPPPKKSHPKIIKCLCLPLQALKSDELLKMSPTWIEEQMRIAPSKYCNCLSMFVGHIKKKKSFSNLKSLKLTGNNFRWPFFDTVACSINHSYKKCIYLIHCCGPTYPF